MELFFVIAGIVLCVILSAFFSGSEMAYSSCNLVRLENEEKDGKKASGRALKIANNFENTLSSILVGNNLVNTAASSLTTVFIILITGSDQLNYIGTIVVTVLIIIFGETAPKMFCKKNANKFAAGVSGIMTFITAMFTPVNFLVVQLVNLLTGRIHSEAEETDEEESVEELQSIIDTAEDEGVLDSDRSELLSAAIDFPEVSADEAMTARVDVEAIDIEDSIEDITLAVLKSTHSRLPVYKGSIDNIIGTVHLNHLLKALAEEKNPDISKILLPPCYVYKTMKLPGVMNTLKKARQHLAIVTDEYSGTLGIISMEDVLENLVGEIWDETDTVEEEVVESGTGELLVDGDMPIDSFIGLLHISEEDFDYESATAGGWMIEMNGDFPKEGYSFEYNGYRLTVIKMDGLRVEKIKIEKTESEKTENQ